MINIKKFKGELGLLLTAMIWGTSFVAADILLEYMTSFQIVAYRFVIASVVMTLLCIKKIKNLKRKTVIWGIIFGTLLYLGFVFQITGLAYTTPSKNAFLNTLSVIIVPFISVFALKHKVDKYSISAAFIALLGTAVLSFNMDFSINKGDALTIVSAFFYAIQLTLMSEKSGEHDAALLTMVQMITCGVLGTVVIIPLGQFSIAPISSASLPYLLHSALICTSLCFFLQAYFQRFTSGVTSAIIFSTEGVFSAIFSIALAIEPLTARLVLGSLLIFGAGIISQTKLSFIKFSRKDCR